MKQNSTKSLYTVLGIALFLAIFNAIHVSVFCIGAFIKPENWGVEWLEHDTWMQYAVLIGRMLGGLAFSAFLTMFIYYTAKGAKAGILFPKQNFGILMACSVALFVYMFCYDNMPLVGLASDAVRQITLDLNTVVCSLTFVVFALMYKIAIRVSEENSLTI